MRDESKVELGIDDGGSDNCVTLSVCIYSVMSTENQTSDLIL